MSGIASAALTIPGSVAPLASCASAASLRICPINTSSATTSPGTRIPASALRGMRHRYAPTRSTFIDCPPLTYSDLHRAHPAPQADQNGPSASLAQSGSPCGVLGVRLSRPSFAASHLDPSHRPAPRGCGGRDRMQTLVVDSIAPEGLALLREHGFDVDEVVRPTKEALYERIGDYEALITRSGTAVTPELLRHAARLRIIGRAGVGVDNIDVDACSRRGIVVVNAPYGNVVSAAEHTVGMLLALIRHIPQAHQALKRLEWDRSIYGSELYRKTAGVLGLGKVGSRVAARLRGFDMEVLVYDPYSPESRARDLGVRLTDFQTVLGQSDVSTVHAPLNDETENMIAAREITAMKPGVRIVNCARGGIVHEGDLLAALGSGHVAG